MEIFIYSGILLFKNKKIVDPTNNDLSIKNSLSLLSENVNLIGSMADGLSLSCPPPPFFYMMLGFDEICLN